MDTTELVNKVRTYDPGVDAGLIERAYSFSMKAHESQVRDSGDPYFLHPVEVARILTELRMDSATIATALLHDTVEDTLATHEDIDRDFGPEVARLVDGVTKLSLLELPATTDRSRQAENFRKMFLAMSDDIRVLLVKLADRLHNMQTLHHLEDPARRRRIAQETMDVYAPLAERIGIRDMKEALEDLVFAELNPDARETVLARLRYLHETAGDVVGRISKELQATLKAKSIDAEVSGREKRAWSIWQKMERDSVPFEQLSDVVAFRVVVATRADCYTALGVVHARFPMVPGRFRDFISTPKRNGYRSLHTTVIGPGRHRIEVQIRCREMHREAELGLAAHWQYKQQAQGADATHYRWIRELLDELDASGNPEEFLENTKLEMFQDHVFCFSPAGELITLPRGATAVDFAYAVHTDVGDTCVGAKIDGRIVPLRTQLGNGDQVEVIRSDTQTPSPGWESFVVTGKARSAIRRFRARQERSEYASLGRKMVRKAFRETGREVEDDKLAPALQVTRQKTPEDLYVAVGAGHVSARAVVEAVLPGEKSARGGEKPVGRKPGAKGGDHAIPIRGLIPGVAVHLASCCHPLPGDRIVGIVSAGKGVTVHTIDCESLQAYADSPETWLDVAWDAEASSSERQVARIVTVLANTPGSLSALTTVIARNRGNISNLKITNRNPDFFEMRVDIDVDSATHVNNIIAALRIDPAISSVERVRG